MEYPATLMKAVAQAVILFPDRYIDIYTAMKLHGRKIWFELLYTMGREDIFICINKCYKRENVLNM